LKCCKFTGGRREAEEVPAEKDMSLKRATTYVKDPLLGDIWRSYAIFIDTPTLDNNLLRCCLVHKRKREKLFFMPAASCPKKR